MAANEVDVEQIRKAIAAHGDWKEKLTAAIDSGSSPADPDVVGVDDKCAFGIWLYGLSDSVKAGERWRNICALHATFHAQAGATLSLAIAGKTEEASASMKFGGAYQHASTALTLALVDWAHSL